jgi:citrate lyase subunit beta/citryl-CoA lyase
MSEQTYIAPRTALFMPASNPRAIEKARGLAVDMVILDLEDAVKAEDKETARAASVEASGTFGGKMVGIRVNAEDSDHFRDDLKAVKKSAATHVVIPKVEKPDVLIKAAAYAKRPILAMIETPAGVMNVGVIASTDNWGVKLAGLIVGTNDLAAGLRLPPGSGRDAMATALQLVVLAARARELWSLDGVFNALDDPEGLEAECRAGRALGFDGKSLIHPGQLEIAARAFAATEGEIADAHALIAAAGGGAERYKDHMIEEMHVEQAKALLAREGVATP